MKKDIRAYGYDRLKEEMEALGEKPFRAKQVYEWLHVKLADDFDEMTNLSKALREKLKEEYVILPVKMLERQISQIDGTNKFLFQLYDGNVVESVLMRYKHGNSVCISSQAGCRMGCAFCASTIGGLQRNLSSSEMYPEAPENGIYIFHDDVQVGADAVEVLGLHDVVFEYEITSNRVDCYSVVGIAREAAATFNKEFKPPVVTETGNNEDVNDYVKVSVENTNLCSRYCARVVKNIKIGPSPEWMQRRLASVGIRPISIQRNENTIWFTMLTPWINL